MTTDVTRTGNVRAIACSQLTVRLLVLPGVMLLNVFMAGPECVRWELTALGPHGNGPFRLVINHSTGAIIEYFDDVTRALLRESELEALLIAARSGAFESDVSWSSVAEETAFTTAH
jgi:hypothetical protein